MKTLTFTDEQFKRLSQWDENFRTATNSQWSRGIGSDADIIQEIWNEVTGKQGHVDKSCGACVLRLLQEVGTAYNADKAARAEVKAGAAEQPKRTRVKVEA